MLPLVEMLQYLGDVVVRVSAGHADEALGKVGLAVVLQLRLVGENQATPAAAHQVGHLFKSNVALVNCINLYASSSSRDKWLAKNFKIPV